MSSPSSAGDTIRIGTRGSALALAQTGVVAAAVAKASGSGVEIVTVATEGDHSTESLASLGGTGVFASALREALAGGACDLVVHSLKDLPTAGYPGLRIGAVPRRADARDALCGRDGLTLEALPAGSRIGTGSPRRAAQLRGWRPDLTVVDIRGNVDTRLRKVESGELDAVVLAAAGLTRLGRLDAVTEFFELGRWATAPGQGALALEVREDHSAPFAAMLKTIDHPTTRLAVFAERAVLARLEAGCAAPIGASAVIDGELLFLTATVYAPDGSSSLTSSHALVLEGSAAERAGLPWELGDRVADELLELGAAAIAPLGTAS
ncbi:hydroxymethylbilane synthase [Lacisediminihabitans profunda]|uniref:hydroxymethylbilane synthase n=1 Tax=Lacisediminihabitans profunda TaxID=2594790 RepID=UPI001FE69100|nr:hydroxymethylbilane synthase [Lacisediminihabitans profunda]